MEEVIYLKWNNYCSTFLKTLKNFHSKESLCDSTLVCHGKYFPVHRLVLSLCSEYFEEIFEKTPCKHPFVIIKDIEPTILEEVLSFVYEGEVKVPHAKLSCFIKAAESLQIKGLNSTPEKQNSDRNTGTSESVTDGAAYYDLSVMHRHGISNINSLQSNLKGLNKKAAVKLKRKTNSAVILDPVLHLQKLPFDNEASMNPCSSEAPSKIKMKRFYRKKEIPDLSGIQGDNCSPNQPSSEVVVSNIKPKRLYRRRTLPLMKTVPRKAKALRKLKRHALNAAGGISPKLKRKELKVPLKPETPGVRKSSRPKKIVNYCLSDDIKMEFGQDYENRGDFNSEEDTTCLIKIASYSGGNTAEFETRQLENIAEDPGCMNIKVEPTEFSFDESCFVQNDLLDNVKSEVCDSNISTSVDNINSCIRNENLFEEAPCIETFGDLLNTNHSTDMDIIESGEDNTVKNKERLQHPMVKIMKPKSTRVNGKKLVTCKYCPYFAFSMCKIKKHMKFHHIRLMQTYKCKFCPYVCSSRGFLKAHESSHGIDKGLKCRYCWYRTVNKHNFKKHEESHFMPKSSHSKTKKISMKNIKADNNSDYISVDDEPTYSGKVDDQATYSSSIVDEPTYSGKIDEETTYSSSIDGEETRHSTDHHSRLAQTYKCKLCPYVCRSRVYIKAHESSHGIDKSLQCRYCWYRSINKYNFKQHEASHFMPKIKHSKTKKNLGKTIRADNSDYSSVNDDAAYSGKVDDQAACSSRIVDEPSYSGKIDQETTYSSSIDGEETRHSSDHHSKLAQTYKCKLCPYVCRSRVFIKAHESSHGADKSLKCRYCWYRTVNKPNFNKHEASHFMSKYKHSKPKKILLENSEADNESTDSDKVDNQAAPLSSIDDEGPRLPVRIDNDTIHLHEVNDDESTNDKEGNIKTNKQEPEIYHGKLKVKKNARRKLPLLQCHSCTYTTSFKGFMRKHMLLHATNVENDETVSGKVDSEVYNGIPVIRKRVPKIIRKCKICPYEVGGRKRLIDIHEELHENPDALKCFSCYYLTKESGNLSRHQRRHLATVENIHKVHKVIMKPKFLKLKARRICNRPHKCMYCGYKSRSIGYLRDHMMMHKGWKPYQCGECDYVTSFRTSLAAHIKICAKYLNQ